MKTTLFLTFLLGFASFSQASSHNHHNKSKIYVCTIKPFTQVFADAGITENTARAKVAERCNQSEGGHSMFCKPERASCITTMLGSERKGNLVIYAHKNQRGASLTMNSDQPDLTKRGFNDKMSS